MSSPEKSWILYSEQLFSSTHRRIAPRKGCYSINYQSQFLLTQFLVEKFDAELRIGDVVIVVGDPWCFAFLGKTGFVVRLDNVNITLGNKCLYVLSKGAALHKAVGC